MTRIRHPERVANGVGADRPQLLEREFRAERNRHLLESMVGRRSLDLNAEEVVADIRGGREVDE